jgi:hypothetical protein
MRNYFLPFAAGQHEALVVLETFVFEDPLPDHINLLSRSSLDFTLEPVVVS